MPGTPRASTPVKVQLKPGRPAGALTTPSGRRHSFSGRFDAVLTPEVTNLERCKLRDTKSTPSTQVGDGDESSSPSSSSDSEGSGDSEHTLPLIDAASKKSHDLVDASKRATKATKATATASTQTCTPTLASRSDSATHTTPSSGSHGAGHQRRPSPTTPAAFSSPTPATFHPHQGPPLQSPYPVPAGLALGLSLPGYHPHQAQPFALLHGGAHPYVHSHLAHDMTTYYDHHPTPGTPYHTRFNSYASHSSAQAHDFACPSSPPPYIPSTYDSYEATCASPWIPHNFAAHSGASGAATTSIQGMQHPQAQYDGQYYGWGHRGDVSTPPSPAPDGAAFTPPASEGRASFDFGHPSQPHPSGPHPHAHGAPYWVPHQPMQGSQVGMGGAGPGHQATTLDANGVAVQRTYVMDQLEAGVVLRRTGTTKFFDTQKGFGFILDDNMADIGGRDIFVHYTALLMKSGFRCLSNKEPVEYDIVKATGGGYQALNVSGRAGAPLRGLTDAQHAQHTKALEEAAERGEDIGEKARERRERSASPRKGGRMIKPSSLPVGADEEEDAVTTPRPKPQVAHQPSTPISVRLPCGKGLRRKMSQSKATSAVVVPVDSD
ncbi:Cold-shock protein, DNA-binding domain containing protein [Pseudohyphozyma bogoriensis]|nr:Cold-shock protein, DNA-binding domain containing protein [Pseudohyphozyma bogoriensis]